MKTETHTRGASGTVTQTVDAAPDVFYGDRKTLLGWLRAAYRRGVERGQHDPPEIITGPAIRKMYDEDCPDLIERMIGTSDEETTDDPT